MNETGGPEESYYYVSRGGATYGPVPLRDLKVWAQRGQLAPFDAVAAVESAQWGPASSVPDLAPYFAHASQRSRRPVGILVLGWVGIAYAALVFCATSAFGGLMAAAASVPEFDRALNDIGVPRRQLTAALAGVVGMVLLMLVSCAGLLGRREWARKLFFVLTAYTVVGTVAAVAWEYTLTQDVAVTAQNVASSSIPLALTIGGSYYLTRPDVVAQFRQSIP
ncbi:MAG: DUF4339 domain-containing protein [Armatimonadota bacterium]